MIDGKRRVAWEAESHGHEELRPLLKGKQRRLYLSIGEAHDGRRFEVWLRVTPVGEVVMGFKMIVWESSM